MSTFATLEEAREYFKNDLFATENGMVIDEIGEDWATCSVVLEPKHRNATGGVMGGAIFTLADFAFAVACNQVHCPTVGLQVSVNYLSGTRGTKLFAHATCHKDGRTSGVYNVDVTDDLGRDIAQFIGTAYKLEAK